MSGSLGQLVAIVGPSGVGKDSIMTGLKEKYPGVHLVQRTITRRAELGGEDFREATEALFQTMKQQGAFALDWQAHGLSYGIPIEIKLQLENGKTVLFNGSRAALSDAVAKFPGLRVILIKAKPETLAERLASRGRESAEEIQKRLERASYEMPEGIEFQSISNDGSLDVAIEKLGNLIIRQGEIVQ